jgi:hypothetical protein
MKAGKRPPVRINVPDSPHVLPLGGISGNIAFFNTQSPGFVQHMLQEGLSFIKELCLACAHPGAFSAGQQKQGVSVASGHDVTSVRV